MQFIPDPSLHLAYCQNVHPADTWEAAFDNIQRFGLAVREQVAPDRPFGLGLRVSHAASLTLRDPGNLAAFKDFLARHDLYVFTINGFPYGPFHRKPVKEQAYAPDWRQPERRDYTLRLAAILAELLPPGVRGSISTVPGSYRAWIESEAHLGAMVEHLMDAVADLARRYESGGPEIHLGLEPEPDCFLETTADAIDFFRDAVPRYGIPYLVRRHGFSQADARAATGRHLGICFDTCHASVQFENPTDALAALHAEHIRISKVQISAALTVAPGQDRHAALDAYCDPVYLHQVRARAGHGIVSLGDLPDALRGDAHPDAEWRVHCHVPLDFEGDRSVGSTAVDLTPSCFAAALAAGAEHFEIETYTLDVLPAALRAQGPVAAIVAEYQWVLPRLKAAAAEMRL